MLSLFYVLLALPATAQENSRHREVYGQEAARIVPGANYVLVGEAGEYPAYVKFTPGSGPSAAGFITWFKKSLKTPAGVDFVLREENTDQLGFVQSVYHQTYKSYPVDRAEIRVQSRDGKVTSFRGTAFKLEGLNLSPGMAENQALEEALAYFGDDEFLWNIPFWENDIKQHEDNPEATYFPKGELVITRFGSSGKEGNSEYRLAYRFDIYALHDQKRVYVDASSGEILYTLPLASNCEPPVNFSSIFNGTQSIQTEKYTASDYRLNDDCLATEVWVRDWGSNTDVASPTEIENTTNTWTSMDERFGATVMWETKQSYFYFNNVHGRASYDGSNGDLKCYINAVFKTSGGTLYTDNASMAFNGSRMKVGLGSSGTLANSWSSIDIIAHEFTHAVTGTSSGLVYQGEPGALNESFSDIFGEMIENYVTGNNDWLMGDDRTSGAIRSMMNPGVYNDPDTYLGTNWAGTCGACSDNGGVHTNSGVQNYWFYLVAVGGSGTNDNGDSYNVSGIGRTKASAIAFRNAVVKLGNNSDYAAARAGAIEAAEDLYGTCSNEVKQVTNAWYAVGVGDPYVDVSVASKNDISCNGAADGSITLDVEGTSPLSVSWSDGPTSTTRTNLGPGNYTATLTDGTGCTDMVVVTINEPATLVASAVGTSNYNGYNISCNGLSDGEATASAVGGTPPYSYQWNGSAGSQTTAVATNLGAGIYSVVVTDANGCSDAANVILTEPPLLTAAITNASDYNGYNISCNGGSDGWATVTGGGGVPPYSYLWSDGQVTATATNMSAGLYGVTITDANGCTATDSILMTEPDPLTIDAGSNQTVYYGYPPAECADIAWSGAGGGVPPYTISWSDGGAQMHQVCPGEFTTDYVVTITDLNGCEESDTVTICVIDVRCGKKLDKVEMCHVPKGDPGNEHSICVSVNAVAKHLAHGDMLAACGTDHSCPPAKSVIASAKELTKLGAYPNPFDQSTTLQFSSSVQGDVSVVLYDDIGRVVKILYQDKVETGKVYELQVTAGDMSAGIGLCVLRHSDGTVLVQKLIMR